MAALQRVNIDADWKFNLGSGAPGTPCPAGSFPDNLNGTQCLGLQEQAQIVSAAGCRAQCCQDETCAVWQWCPEGSSDCSPAATCWTGSRSNCQKGPGWISAGRTVTPAPPSPAGKECTQPQCQVDYDDSKWRTLSLPHDFIVEGGFDPKADKSHGYRPYNLGWYRKHLTIPADWKGKQVWLEFDGAQTESQVYFNGLQVADHLSGYTSILINMEDAKANVSWGGTNVVAVKVDARHPDSWWYDGGGIYRHVWLAARGGVHIEPRGVYVPAKVDTARISTSAINAAGLAAPATLNISTEVRNRGSAAAAVTVKSTVKFGGNVVATHSAQANAAPGAVTFVIQEVSLPSAELWSLERTALYTLSTELSVGGAVSDTEDTTFGVRSTRWDTQQGFFLNEKPTKVKGMCQHQDFAGIGVAVPGSIEAYRVWRLKEMGTNAWRTAHNPPNPELLNQCDEQGMLVWDENHRNRNTGQYVDDLRDLIRRDRNHPSVILWSICNEALCDGFDVSVAKTLKPVIKELDPHGGRLVTAAMNGGYTGDFPAVLDVMGINYHHKMYDSWHSGHGNQPVIGSETSSALTDRGVYSTDATAGYISAYDTHKPSWGSTAEDAWVPVATRDFVAGAFIWTGFDYRGEPTPYAWPNINSHFGSIDVCGFPKDGYYYYQSVWKDGGVPMVHLFPHWNWDTAKCAGLCSVRGGGAMDVNVWAYSNADEVELFVNGASQGRKSNPKQRSPMGRSASTHVEWTVPYAPGNISVLAYNNGSTIVAARAVRETTGAAAAVVLEQEWPISGGLKADNVDAALITVRLVDAQGRFVPTAAAKVSFALSGPGRIIGVGNGDPSSHEADKPDSDTSASRSAWNGLARVVLQSGAQAGALKLSASADGLKGAAITVPVQ
eukprot:TRINITY_DN817_c2_g1_i2.p1 TRINITY_DN817_c2_g1~~TRINITY_DN817_c2_g1_i2.p1  ORF type:complete len:932 (+),score=288.83 TRINITY_DN817_c2_g1_i2:121-2796(+)